jgi:hypothetical protein
LRPVLNSIHHAIATNRASRAPDRSFEPIE